MPRKCNGFLIFTVTSTTVLCLEMKLHLPEKHLTSAPKTNQKKKTLLLCPRTQKTGGLFAPGGN